MESKGKVHLENIRLLGIATHTNNHDELNPTTAKIPNFIQYYHQERIADKFGHHVNPGVTYCVYADYENGVDGNYTYFVGEEVSSIVDEDHTLLRALVIPNGSYAKFSVGPGPISQIIPAAWQQIWQMNEQQLGGKRRFEADFELYDRRSRDTDNAIVDIFIGLRH